MSVRSRCKAGKASRLLGGRSAAWISRRLALVLSASCFFIGTLCAQELPSGLTVLDRPYAEALFSEIAGDESLPFDFPDGCHAKAQKIAVMLEQKGIVSGKAFVEGDLFLNSRWEQSLWKFHVAPFILSSVEDEIRPFVIDPFFSDKLLAYDEWIALLKKDPRTRISKAYFTDRFVYTPKEKDSDPEWYVPEYLHDTEVMLEQLRVRIKAAAEPWGDAGPPAETEKAAWKEPRILSDVRAELSEGGPGFYD